LAKCLYVYECKECGHIFIRGVYDYYDCPECGGETKRIMDLMIDDETIEKIKQLFKKGIKECVLKIGYYYVDI